MRADIKEDQTAHDENGSVLPVAVEIATRRSRELHPEKRWTAVHVLAHAHSQTLIFFCPFADGTKPPVEKTQQRDPPADHGHV